MKKGLWVLLATGLMQGCSSTLFLPEEDAALLERVMSEMILVEGGSYLRGESCELDVSACPAQEVTISDFSIAKYELTQDIFFEVIGSDVSYFRGDNMPVNHVTWQQVQYFISKLNQRTGKTFRLPTEAEWEYAAKGGNLHEGFLYSGTNDIESVAWIADNANNRAHPVGQKAPNALGLYDMTGNVGEWVQDAYEARYEHIESVNDPIYDTQSKHNLAYKSVRGGSFSYSEQDSRNTSRDFASQTAMMADIGFRLVLSN